MGKAKGASFRVYLWRQMCNPAFAWYYWKARRRHKKEWTVAANGEMEDGPPEQGDDAEEDQG